MHARSGGAVGRLDGTDATGEPLHLDCREAHAGLLRLANRRVATVHDKDLSSDVRGVIGCKKTDDAGDVVWRTKAFEWNLLRARCLTQSRRGREAFDLLSSLSPTTQDEQSALDWERVRAMAEAGA